jgi:hypothetical protein
MNKEVKVIMQSVQDYDEIVKKAWELAQVELDKGIIKNRQMTERIDRHTLGMMALHESGAAVDEFDE